MTGNNGTRARSSDHSSDARGASFWLDYGVWLGFLLTLNVLLR